jgi:enamine deaminase RidA (YjgF/YER057c/UK114 family)
MVSLLKDGQDLRSAGDRILKMETPKEVNMAEIKAVNPWEWQDEIGFSQAIEVQGAKRIVYCSGQTSVDSDGRPLYRADMPAQMNQALNNLEEVLKKAGLNLHNVVRLTCFTTDVPAFMSASAVFNSRLTAAGCKSAQTLIGVARLFHPDIMLEIEATAVF